MVLPLQIQTYSSRHTSFEQLEGVMKLVPLEFHKRETTVTFIFVLRKYNAVLLHNMYMSIIVINL